MHRFQIWWHRHFALSYTRWDGSGGDYETLQNDALRLDQPPEINLMTKW